MSKTLVCVIVYDRYNNLVKWLETWDKCNKTNTDLFVIHNVDYEFSSRMSPDYEWAKYADLCIKHGVIHIKRPNVGMDIGALKDVVCKYNIADYDNIIWCTDDTIPMDKQFVSKLVNHLSDTVGVSCMEISNRNSPVHVRTTGFCMKVETAKRIVFPDNIETKEDCYQFEHRGKNTLYLQIRAMGLQAVQVAPLDKSPLWDTHNRSELKRWAEHARIFGDTPTQKITFICPVYNNYPQIISSLICQTNKNWELRLIHDGANKTGLQAMVDSINDPRITYSETPKHKGNWGHYIRQQEIAKLYTGLVCITNADNYHTPNFVDAMSDFDHGTIATYCSSMVHSYVHWGVIPCKPERGYIDCAGVVIRADVAKAIGWRDIHSHSADWVFFSDILKTYGTKSFKKINGTLLIHN